MNAFIEATALQKTFARRGIFPTRGGGVRAVDGVDLAIPRGEALGLVGESGCGKSTTGRLLLRLIEPDAGAVLVDGRNVAALSGKDMRYQRRHMQIIFQDPYSSLNPLLTIGAAIAEAFAIHQLGSRSERRQWTADILDLVRLPRAAADRYPHEFSGGQRQRVGIARALALKPSFIVCDEVVSALDVSVQAQIINLLQDLQRELKLTYLFISHNLAVVRHISTRIAVMYLGRIVETAPSEALFDAPLHPYTRALLSSIPPEHPDAARQRIPLSGDVPDPHTRHEGCRFANRCAFAEARCRKSDPELQAYSQSRAVACYRAIDRSLPYPGGPA